MGVVLRILESLEEAGVAGPGDLVAATGLPRYKVLAAVKCLEELGLVEPIYSKGSYRVYRLSRLGARLLEEARSGVSLPEALESGLSLSGVHSAPVSQAAEGAEAQA